MRHTMVTYTVKPGREDENAALVRAVFEELAEERPEGLRYAVFQLPETRQFVTEGLPSSRTTIRPLRPLASGASIRPSSDAGEPSTIAR